MSRWVLISLCVHGILLVTARSTTLGIRISNLPTLSLIRTGDIYLEEARQANATPSGQTKLVRRELAVIDEPQSHETVALTGLSDANPSHANTPVNNAVTNMEDDQTSNSENGTHPLSSLVAYGNKLPEYPELAKNNGWEGKVLLSVVFDKTGRANQVSIAKSSGFEILDTASMRTAVTWNIPKNIVATWGTEFLVPVVYELE